MAPKRRAAAPPSTSPSQPTRAKSTRAAATRTSKNNLSSSLTEADILSAFQLFAIDLPEDANAGSDDEGDEYSHEGVIPVADVRRCLSTLNLPKPPPNLFDKKQTHVSCGDFVALAKTLSDSPVDDDDEEEEDASSDELSAPPSGDESEDAEEVEEEEDEDVRPRNRIAHTRKPPETGVEQQQTARKAGKQKRKAGAQQDQDVDAAFALFTHDRSTQSTSTRITLADLRRIAKDLREDVDDATLKLMIEEANGDGGKQSIAKGVGREEFEAVMRRAGVFG